jgi:hypothetical protein
MCDQERRPGWIGKGDRVLGTQNWFTNRRVLKRDAQDIYERLRTSPWYEGELLSLSV